MIYIAIYSKCGKKYTLIPLDEYLEQPGRIELSDVAIICRLNPHIN